MIECSGVYRMESTGRIVREPSIRIEIASDEEIPAAEIIENIKKALNQETVMLEISESNISYCHFILFHYKNLFPKILVKTIEK